MKITYPMDLKTYQIMKIRSFFSLGLTFSVSGDQLKVQGFKQWPPDDRQELSESIRQNKAGIMAEVKRLQDRLSELIKAADHSKGLSMDQIEVISEEGTEIMDQLPEIIIQEIFKQ